MPVRHESYCEGVRRCCCSSSNRVTNYIYDVGSSESEDDILNSQLADIKKILQPNTKSETPKSCCSRICHDLSLSGVDTYFFKYTVWQNMHLGTLRGFNSLDFTLYRFLHTVVATCIFLYYINIISNDGRSNGIIYFEAWILLVNAIYSSVFLIQILKDKFRLYRGAGDNTNEEDAEAQDATYHTINPIQIRQIQDNPVDKITVTYQLCWLLLNIFMATHFALTIVLLAGYWKKRKSTGFVFSIAVIHAVHSIGVILEIMVSRIPIRISHFIYPIMFTHIYAGFTIVESFTEDKPIYSTMDWKRDFAMSYIRILVFCLITVASHIMLYCIFRFREWLIYKVERNRHIHIAHKDAVVRRKARRRIRLDLILDKCNSEEMFEYVNKHIDLFPEVITELKDYDPWKQDVLELRETLLVKEDQNAAREREQEKQSKAAKRLQLRIEARAKQLSVNDADEKQAKGAFLKLMNDVMGVVVERRRQEKEEKERLAAEVKESMRLKEEAHQKWLEDHPLKHIYPKGHTGYIEDYIDYFDGCKSQSMKVLEKPGPHHNNPKHELQGQQKAITDYDHEVMPTNRDSDPKTFSGLPKALVNNVHEARDRRNSEPAKKENDEPVETKPMDEYDLQLELIRLEKIERGHFPPLDHHIETTRLWVNPDQIRKTNNLPLLNMSALDDPKHMDKGRKVDTQGTSNKPTELLKTNTLGPTTVMIPKVKLKKANPRYDRHGLPPPAPEGAKIVYLEPVPKDIDGPQDYQRIPRIPEIRFPEKKWYRIDTFGLEEKQKAASESKSEQSNAIVTPSLMDHYGKTVDTRILERIRAKQQALEEQVDHGIRLKPSGRVGSRSRRLTNELQKQRKNDWDLNIELHRYLKAHQANRDKRLAMKRPKASKKDGSRPREISMITSPESSTASVVPILISESLTEQDKEKLLIKQPGASILIHETQEKKEDEPKKFIKNEDGTTTAVQQEAKAPGPTLSELQFERRAAQIQARTDAHGPIANGMYHPLRPPPVKQAQVRTTFHFIDDLLPHTGGQTYVNTSDVPAYSEHPGIHIHHPMLHLNKPEGPLPLLNDAIKEQAAKRARLKGGIELGATDKKNKIKYGESENRKEFQVVAFHPIVQYHSLTQIVTKKSNEDLYDLEELAADNENSLVDIIKHHENWLHRQNQKDKSDKPSKRRRRSNNKNKPL